MRRNLVHDEAIHGECTDNHVKKVELADKEKPT